MCALLSAVSSFSSANGLVCWIVVFPVLAESKITGERKKRKWLTPFWSAGFAACAALYFYNFERPPYLPSISEPFVRPLAAVAYFLAFLGAPLTGNNRYLVPVAALLGLVLATLFISAWLFRARHLSDTGLRRPMTCWLMIGAYSVMTGALVTLGRLGFGVHQSLSSRYTTFSLYLVVSLIHVAVIARDHWSDRAKVMRLLPTRLLPIAAALIVFYILSSAVSIRATHQLRARILQGKGCLLFVNVLTDECRTPDGTVFPEKLSERLNALDAMGFLRPGLIKSRRAREFAADGTRTSGSFDQLSRNGDVFVASGRAVLPDRQEPPDAILLTYTRKDDEPVLFSIAEPNYNGDILRSILDRDPDDIFRWQKTFPQGSIPADAVGVSAWAFDSNTGKAYELEGAQSLR